MTDHCTPPHATGIEICIVRFGADGSRIKQYFGALQRHDASTFGIPLIPAYADADPRSEHIPYLEPVVAGAEVVFLFVARSVRNMAFAVCPHDFAIRADHGERVVVMLAVTFEKACRNGHL